MHAMMVIPVVPLLAALTLLLASSVVAQSEDQKAGQERKPGQHPQKAEKPVQGGSKQEESVESKRERSPDRSANSAESSLAPYLRVHGTRYEFTRLGTQNSAVAMREALAISVNVRFFAGRNGNVDPSASHRFLNARLCPFGVVVHAPPSRAIGSVPA